MILKHFQVHSLKFYIYHRFGRQGKIYFLTLCTIDINPQILPGKNLHRPNGLGYDFQRALYQTAKRYHSIPSEMGNHIHE